MLLLITVTIIVCIFSYLHLPFLYYYAYLKKIPSPTFWPFIGHGLMFIKQNSIFETLEGYMKNLKRKSILLNLPTHTLVVTQDYKLIEHILKSQTLIDKGYEYRFFEKCTGNSLFIVGGQEWHKKRKFLTPAFDFKILERFQYTFNSNASIMISELRKHPDKRCMGISPFLVNYSLDTICKTVMGISVNAQQGATPSPYCTAVHRILEIINARIISPLYRFDFLYNMSAQSKEEERLVKFCTDFHDDIICMRRQMLSEEKPDNSVFDKLGGKKKIPFLDLLLQANDDGQVLTNKEISNEVTTFMTGGHDTVSSAACFAIYLLSIHPEVQQKVVIELQKIFGNDTDRPATLTDLQSMTYLTWVIKETLRLYPPAPFISRKNYKEFTVDGITYPIGINIVIFIYGLHRDAEFFEDPEKFDPERFSPTRYDAKKPFAYIPFSAGVRNCIGQKFAMLELKTVISSILRNFFVKPTTPRHLPEILPNTLLQSSNGIKVSLWQR